MYDTDPLDKEIERESEVLDTDTEKLVFMLIYLSMLACFWVV